MQDMKVAVHGLCFLLLCTQLFFGEPLTLAQAQGGEHRTAFSSTLPKNPAIEALLDSVSTDSLRFYLETLVGFHTRHTDSDTVSETIGIGAALYLQSLQTICTGTRSCYDKSGIFYIFCRHRVRQRAS